MHENYMKIFYNKNTNTVHCNHTITEFTPAKIRSLDYTKTAALLWKWLMFPQREQVSLLQPQLFSWIYCLLTLGGDALELLKFPHTTLAAGC